MKPFAQVSDHEILAVNPFNIIYRDKSGNPHTIDYDACIENYRKETGYLGRYACVGERDITKMCICFYTSGIYTVISFDKLYVFNLFGKRVISGTRVQRFHQLCNRMKMNGYITRDLS